MQTRSVQRYLPLLICVLVGSTGGASANAPEFRCPAGSEQHDLTAAGLVAHWCTVGPGPDEFPHGEFLARWPSGERAIRGGWHFGTPVGAWKAWHANGKPAWSGEFGHSGELGDRPEALPKPVNYAIGSARPRRHGRHGEQLATGKWKPWYVAAARALREHYYPVESSPPGRGRDGTWQFWYANGRMKSEENYADQKRQGLFKTWFESGQLKEESNFVDGRKEGRFGLYAPNGVKVQDLHYVGGNLKGAAVVRRKDGSIEERGTYGDVGKQGIWSGEHRGGSPAFETTLDGSVPQGPTQRWYPNSQLAVRGNYADGKRTGRFDAFYLDGLPRSVNHWRDGTRHGRFELWHASGQRRMRGRYADGKLDGEYERWYSSGNLEEHGSYVSGKREGLWQRFYPSGKARDQGTYDMGDKHGPWKTWYPNGELKSEGGWASGRRHGLLKEFHHNSEIRGRGEFTHGKKDGEFTTWYYDGVVESKGRYADGREVGEWEKNSRYDPDRPSGSKNLLYDLLWMGKQLLGSNALECPGNAEPTELRTAAAWTERGCVNAENERVGDWKGWYRFGELRFEYHYVVGKLDGVARTYSEVKHLTSEAHYENGVPVGEYGSWKRGNPERRGQYSRGVPVGRWQQWDDMGIEVLDLELDAKGQLIRWKKRNGDGALIETGEPAGDGLYRVRKHQANGSIRYDVSAEAGVVPVQSQTHSYARIALPKVQVRKRVGAAREWNNDLEFVSGSYAEGLREGTWSRWMSDGGVAYGEYRAGKAVEPYRY